MPPQRKLFAIEKSWAEQASRPTSGPMPSDDASVAAIAVDNGDVLHAIDTLSVKLDRFLSADHTEIERIRIEVSDIAGRIQATKAEIAALRHPLEPNDKFLTAAAELGAVVSDAESATHTIMNQAERVDEIVGELRSHVGDAYGAARLADAADAITRIFEACNFQDLTGQRIGKVTRTLSFIEERVNAMLLLWNSKELEALPMSPSLDKVDNGLELHGPAGGAQPASISQNDIDALFD
jgi:chemotaxis protein CheZ